MPSVFSLALKVAAALALCVAALPAAAQPPAQGDIAAVLTKLTQAIESQTAKIDALVTELRQSRPAAVANFEAAVQPAAVQPPVAQPPIVAPAPGAAPAVVVPAGDVPLLADDGAPPLGATETIGPFGLDAFVAEFHAGNRLRTDQEPDVTAALIAKLFSDLAAQFRSLPGPLDEAKRSELRQAYELGVKGILDDPQRGFERRPQWQGFFVQLEAKLAQAKQGIPATFQVANPGHYAVALTELAHGFTELANALRSGRDLPPSYFQNRGAAAAAASGAGYAGGYSGVYSGGATHAAVWHARRMDHIIYRFDRRAYKLDRIQGRR